MNSESVPITPVSERPIGIVSPLNNCPPAPTQQPEGRGNESSFGISTEGFPEGSTPAQIVRCIQLLEHVFRCSGEPEPGGCPEGEACRRTRQVLAHHFACRNGAGECNICLQVLALCRNHSARCQAKKGDCAVPYCMNKKVKIVQYSNKIPPNSPTEAKTRQEHKYVIGKLSEAVDFPSKQQKLRAIEYLMENNRQATVQVLRHIIEKKHKSQPVPLTREMKNLIISKLIKPSVDKSPQRLLNPDVWSSALTCSIKLNVVVRAPL